MPTDGENLKSLNYRDVGTVLREARRHWFCPNTPEDRILYFGQSNLDLGCFFVDLGLKYSK